MATKEDCTAIEQANAQLDTRILALDSEIDEMRNLLNSLYADDPQRSDVQRKLADLAQQHEKLSDELRKGEVALRKCQQQTNGE